jgi:hypothetical protein
MDVVSPGEDTRRAALGLVLIDSQGFLYNGLSPALALLLTNFPGVAEDRDGLDLLPFSPPNVLGPGSTAATRAVPGDDLIPVQPWAFDQEHADPTLPPRADLRLGSGIVSKIKDDAGDRPPRRRPGFRTRDATRMPDRWRIGGTPDCRAPART